MSRRELASRGRSERLLALPMALLLLLTACAGPPPQGKTGTDRPGSAPASRALEAQSLAMGMADDYIASLSETVYSILRASEQEPRARALAESFLRNGVGASIDIAAAPNPSVAILDLLVLASLQTWSFEAHWIPLGIRDPDGRALSRLKRAETEMWRSAGKMLSDEDLATVRRLIDAWISENPERTVVSLVRFNDFGDARKVGSLSLRGQASGLLHEVSEATGAIDDARLLGERALWFASRYPYLLGEQIELTAYRLGDQPEAREFVETLRSIKEASKAATSRLEGVMRDLQTERETLFKQVASERVSAIQQARTALEETVQNALKDAEGRIAAQRQAAIDQFFRSVSSERKLLLDDIESREAPLRGLISELRGAAASSEALATELTKTLEAVDRVVARFDAESRPGGKALSLADVREAAAETKRAAEQITRVLDRTNDFVSSGEVERRLASLAEPANAIVDRAFWRGVILVLLLIVGMGIVRLIPARRAPSTGV